MSRADDYLGLLGTVQRDRVTSFQGMVASIHFDAYGCVQAWLTPPIGKDGKIAEGAYFDVKRLEPRGKRIMPAPSFGSFSKPETQIGAERKAPPPHA